MSEQLAPSTSPNTRLSMAQGLWMLLWLYFPASNGLAVFFSNLYLLSALNVACAVLICATLVLLFSFRPSGIGRFSPMVLLVLGINLATIASVIASPVAFESPSRIYGNLASCLAMSTTALLACHMIREPKLVLRRMAGAFVLGASFTCLLALGRSLNIQVQLDDRGGYGEILHPNVVGFLATMALVFLTSGLWGYRKPGLWILMGFFGLVALLSFSKTSLGAFLAALLILFLLLNWRQRLGWLLLVPVAISPGSSMLIEKVFYYVEQPDSSSLTGRFLFWLLALDLAYQRPFLGWGLGTLREVVAFAAYDIGWTNPWTNTQAHNAYLNVAAQVGLCGLAPLVLLLLWSLFLLVKWWIRSHAVEARLALMLWMYLFARSWTEGSFGKLDLEWALLATLGLVAERALRESAHKRPTRATPQAPAKMPLADALPSSP